MRAAGDLDEHVRDGYRLVRTCGACPEQYDVFQNERQVGYLRLRHGWFTVEAPGCDGAVLLELRPRGDGIFEDDERDSYLDMAVAAIRAHAQQEHDG